MNGQENRLDFKNYRQTFQYYAHYLFTFPFYIPMSFTLNIAFHPNEFFLFTIIDIEWETLE